MLRVDQNFGTNTRLYVKVSRDQDWTQYDPTLYGNATFDTAVTDVFQDGIQLGRPPDPYLQAHHRERLLVPLRRQGWA